MAFFCQASQETMKPYLLRCLGTALAGLLLLLAGGCAGQRLHEPQNERAFDFKRDTFSYNNELGWVYQNHPVTGERITQRTQPRPEFSQRCFAVSRMARQFYQYAQFAPDRARVSEKNYQEIISSVMSRSPEQYRREGKVLVPGYADLRSFSQAHETLLKTASGSALRSYFKLSNWRMVFPFSRSHQQTTARRLLAAVRANQLAIVHLIRFAPFPVTKIDHAVVIYDAVETAGEIRFRIYDPNNSAHPGLMSFNNHGQSFVFPTTNYFTDGPIDAYEIEGDEIG